MIFFSDNLQLFDGTQLDGCSQRVKQKLGRTSVGYLDAAQKQKVEGGIANSATTFMITLFIIISAKDLCPLFLNNSGVSSKFNCSIILSAVN